MGWLNKVFSTGISETVSSISDAVKPFITTEADRQQFALEAQRIVTERTQAIELRVQKELEAKQRIVEAEMAQGDNYTKRARPTVVYAGLVFIAVNHVLMPFLLGVAKTAGVELAPADFQLELPAEFWMAWGGICATWVISRTKEKVGQRNAFTQAITGNTTLAKATALLD